MQKRVVLLSKRGKPVKGFLVQLAIIIKILTGILFCLKGELFLRLTYQRVTDEIQSSDN